MSGWEPPPPPWPPPPPASWPPPPAPASWPPPPSPPRRSRTGLVVGLSVGGAVVVLGGALLGLAVLGSLRRDRGPRADIDHWHAAYGLYLCDRYLAPIRVNGDQAGIHTHGDGIVHVEPFNRAGAGDRAVFRRFEEAEGMRITSSSVRFVEGTVPIEAEVGDGCGGRPAELASFVDGKRVSGDPGKIRLRDGQVIVVALVPKGTSYADIGVPPSAANLSRRNAPRP